MTPRLPSIDQIGHIPPRTPELERAAAEAVARAARDDEERAQFLAMLDLQEAS